VKLLLSLLLAGTANAFAGQACVFSDFNLNGDRRCFEADRVVDVPEGIPVKSVQIARDVELVVGTNVGMTGRIERYRDSTGYAHSAAQSAVVYKSFHVVPRACIYQHARYEGRKACFAPGAMETELTDTFDRQASSVLMSPGLALYLFSEKNGKGGSFYRYVDHPFIASFNDRARSLQVVRRKLKCHENCVIGFSEGYNLKDVVDSAFRGHRLSQAVMTFQMSSRQQFSVYISNAIRVEFFEHTATLYENNTDRIVGKLQLPHNAAYTSIVLDYDAADHVDIQLVASDSSRGYLDASPIATFPRSPGLLDAVVALDAEVLGVQLKSLSLAQVSQSARMMPASKCWKRPLLTLGTWFLGPCSDTSGKPSVQPGAILHTAGALPNANFSAVIPVSPPATSTPETTLTSYSAMGRNPMALHAASRVCRTDVGHIAAPRMRRGVDNPATCVERTMTLIALFQTLFGPHWSAENFQQVVDSILTHGTTGYASSNPAVEAELIAAVRQRADGTDGGPASSAASDPRRQTAMAAFYAADQLFATSRLGTPNLEVAAARMNATGSLDVIQSESAPATLAEARSAPLGLYQLDMRQFQPRTVRPRVLQEGRWVESSEPFTFQVINSNDTQNVQRLSSVLQSWRDDYRIFAQDNSLSRGQVSLSATGRNMADSTVGAIRRGDAAIYVLALFRGIPVSVLMGSIAESDPTTAEVDSVVSHPLFVTYADRDGTVRGGASAGLQHFLTHLQQRGVRTVEAVAITTPSALVKKRAGFQLLELAPDSESESDSGSDSGSDSKSNTDDTDRRRR